MKPFRRLLELDEMLDPEFVDTLVDGFVSEARKSAAQIRAHLRAGDADALSRTAHRLLGSCRNLGFEMLGRHCERLEQTAEAGFLDQVAAQRVLEDIAALETELHEWRHAPAT